MKRRSTLTTSCKVIPAEAGIQTPSQRKQGTINELDSRFHGKPWIPHPPIAVEGRQVRNDERGLFFCFCILSLMIALCGLIAPAYADDCVSIDAEPPSTEWLYGCESRLTTNPADQYDPAISGDLVVYTDARAGNADVWYYDIGAGHEVQVTNALGDQKLSDVSGGLVVYVDQPTTDVIVYSAGTGSTTNLTASETPFHCTQR